MTELHAELTKIHVEYAQDPELCPDVRWVYKLEAKGLRTLQLLSQNRLAQKHPFRKKYEQMQVAMKYQP